MSRLLKLSIVFIATFTLLVPPRILTKPAFAVGVVAPSQSSATEFNKTGGCDFTNIGESAVGNANVWLPCTFAKISAFVLSLAADLLYRAGTMFDFAVNYGLNMAARLNDFSFVSNGWAVFRDVTNLAYIFILLYIAINIILGNSGYGDKSLIAKVLVTAVFVNFSLFGAKLIIDTTNIAALQFYNLITPASSTDTTAISATDRNSKSLTGQFMNLFALQTIYGNYGATSDSILNSVGSSVTSNTQANYSQSSTWWNMGKLCVFGTLFVLAVTVVFFAGAFLFLSRTLVLFFLMVFSALAVASRALPSTKSQFDTWLKKLINNAIFAPIFLGLIYIFVSATNTYKSPLNLANVILNGGNISGIVTFFMYLAFLTGILLVAKQLGITGGEFAHGVAEKYISPKAVATRTVGAGITKIAESEIMRQTLGKVPGFGRALGNVGKWTGYDKVQKEQEEASKEKHDYVGGMSPQGRFETNARYKKRKERADARGLSSLGINQKSEGHWYSGIVNAKNAITTPPMNFLRALIGGPAYRKQKETAAKAAKAKSRSKDRKKKVKAATWQGLEKLTGLQLAKNPSAKNPELDSTKVINLFEALEGEKSINVKPGTAPGTWMLDINSKPPITDIAGEKLNAAINALSAAGRLPTLSTPPTPVELAALTATVTDDERFKQEIKSILAKATSLKNIMEKEDEEDLK